MRKKAGREKKVIICHVEKKQLKRKSTLRKISKQQTELCLPYMSRWRSIKSCPASFVTIHWYLPWSCFTVWRRSKLLDDDILYFKSVFPSDVFNSTLLCNHLNIYEKVDFFLQMNRPVFFYLTTGTGCPCIVWQGSSIGFGATTRYDVFSLWIRGGTKSKENLILFFPWKIFYFVT